MLHYVKKEKEEPLAWRDPGDIREEMRETCRKIAAAHTCYEVLETACKRLASVPDREATATLLDTLLGEARETLSQIDEACVEMNSLAKELRETRCLLIRM